MRKTWIAIVAGLLAGFALCMNAVAEDAGLPAAAPTVSGAQGGAPGTWTLRYAAGEHGSIWGTTTQPVEDGKNGLAVTALPDFGWHFVQWSDGVPGAVRQDNGVKADLSVTALFAEGAVAYRVNMKDTRGPFDGASWDTAFHDIQAAVDYAAGKGGGEVWVAAGSYSSTNNPVVTMRPTVRLCGGFAGTESLGDQRDWMANATVIDGKNARRCVVGADATVLDGFTVTGGHAPLAGGGMYNEDCSPTVANCVFTGNWASGYDMGGGGGMANNSASPTVTNCAFLGNTAYFCGGGMVNYLCSPLLTNCTFIGNSTNSMGGGGLFNASSSPTVMNCAFIGNSAIGCDISGGGVYNFDPCSPTIVDCTFIGNWSSGVVAAGGAMMSETSSPTIVNCTFTGNSATGAHVGGGALFNEYGWPTIKNCTFAGNSANGSDDAYGGAVANSLSDPVLADCTFGGNSAGRGEGGAIGNLSACPTLTNCVLWGDLSSSGAEIYNDPEAYTSVTHSCIQGGYAGIGNINANPRLGDADRGFLRLGAGSPRIGTGTTTGVPATDIRGTARPRGAGVDMGACESN